MQHKFIDFIEKIDANIVMIVRSETTMENSFDIILENEDYTMGKAIEFVLYDRFYEKEKKLAFCGFKKLHPHNTESMIRIAFVDNMDHHYARQCLRECCVDIQEFFKKLYRMF